MRPTPHISSFPRKGSFDHSSPSIDPRTAGPATFFLSRSPHASDLEPESPIEDTECFKESLYGVQSLVDTLSQSDLAGSCSIDHPADNGPIRTPFNKIDDLEESPILRRRSTVKPLAGFLASPIQQPTSDTICHHLTPLNPDEPSSLPSSPKSISNQSLRPLDDISITDEINSQVFGSGDEEDKSSISPLLGPAGASQLIMPSIRMPSRRPFTERGKDMGRFKLLLAGASGSGKTSLIKAIVQKCEDIVHVDSMPTINPLECRRSSRPHSGSVPTRGVVEIYASTKPYPAWWSDLEDSRVLRRRKGLGEIVLERNICFVDTPATYSNQEGQTDAILQYMLQQLQRATTNIAGPTIDFQNLLAGNGGPQVDAILYLISKDTLLKDVECIRKLCELTNVIPVVAKADNLLHEEVALIKSQFHQKAHDAGIKPFLFGDPPPELDRAPQPPYAVSSERTTDMETMDASTLMSPDYVQPLVISELDTLVQKLFDHDNLAWMRHSASKKLIQRYGDFGRAPLLQNALSGTTGPQRLSEWRIASGASMTSSISSLYEPQPGYAMSRIIDYTRHEECIAQVRLAQWATDLQRSLQNERDQYAMLARGDRAVWLTERLGECIVDGSLVPISKTPGFCGLNISTGEKTMRRCGSSPDFLMSNLNPHDPLGIVDWIDDLGRRGLILVQIVGTVGVVGGLALWLARTWGLPVRSLSELQLEHW
ncbi:hypothetical protein N7495_000704 [Penicillium taxi]|uniref:uncharacterized protein n=1 Tax=Penicillium taxi TaxID=168475 RepID=UPI00254526B5|nr:uncharacterized protein N7495_000704 [Penicillium taxi]KAJ5908022.1 hypothetical protein N7495_000704 [Penicillium taxi]